MSTAISIKITTHIQNLLEEAIKYFSLESIFTIFSWVLSISFPNTTNNLFWFLTHLFLSRNNKTANTLAWIDGIIKADATLFHLLRHTSSKSRQFFVKTVNFWEAWDFESALLDRGSPSFKIGSCFVWGDWWIIPCFKRIRLKTFSNGSTCFLWTFSHS